MANNSSFVVGNDTRVVIIGPYGRLDFSHVVGFSSQQIVKSIDVAPLGRPPIRRYNPGGWTFGFEIDRNNSVADDLAAQMEQAFWSGQLIATGTLYQYVNETDGSRSTYQFDEIVLTLKDAGKYHQDAAVKQMVDGFASRKRRV